MDATNFPNEIVAREIAYGLNAEQRDATNPTRFYAVSQRANGAWAVRAHDAASGCPIDLVAYSPELYAQMLGA